MAASYFFTINEMINIDIGIINIFVFFTSNTKGVTMPIKIVYFYEGNLNVF